MLSRAAFERYDRQVRNLAKGAEDYTRRMVDAFLGKNPDASVDECREFARAVMEQALRVYGDAAATAAADYYDSIMETSGNGAPRALLGSSVDAAQVEKTARYQAGKLVNGDAAGFVRECASYAADATKKAANDTTLKNAKRDGKRGVRFARVPTGAETCTFCRMLASRGFVYKSAKSAGEFSHFHRGCDCRIVASTDSEGLEGYDPDRELELWREFQEIEDGEGTRAEKRAKMRAVLEGSNGPANRFSRIEGPHNRIYDLAASNPNYSQGIEWQSNCQRCVAAYELRRRGYDVTALPRPMMNGSPDRTDDLPNRFSENGWPMMFEGSVLEPCKASTGARTMGKVERLMASWGDGSRAIVRVQWQKRYGGSGHVFIAEQRNGKTYFIDPQSNDRDCSRYFNLVDRLETYCMRVDNLKETDLVEKAVTNR